LENIRRNFFANVSHELHTFLKVLPEYLKMMSNKSLDAALCAKALDIYAGAGSAYERMLVTQILMLSLIEVTTNLQMNENG
jgi:two-component system phosphate regulon sensor histidine kinase PhoR